MPRIDYATEIAALARQVAGLDERASSRLEEALRREYGGQSVRIAQKPVAIDMALVDAELRKRTPVRQIAQQMGVSRMTIYRHLSRPKVTRRGPDGTPDAG